MEQASDAESYVKITQNKVRGHHYERPIGIHRPRNLRDEGPAAYVLVEGRKTTCCPERVFLIAVATTPFRDE
jgi:hypothetical protein